MSLELSGKIEDVEQIKIKTVLRTFEHYGRSHSSTIGVSPRRHKLYPIYVSFLSLTRYTTLKFGWDSSDLTSPISYSHRPRKDSLLYGIQTGRVDR